MRASGWICLSGVVACGIALVGCGNFNPRDEQAQAGLPAVPGMDSSGGEDTDAAGDGAADSGGGADGGSSGGADGPRFDVGTDDEGPATSCNTPPDFDDDGDGFTESMGDCNDCDPNVNPGAIEVIIPEPDEQGNVATPADENCDGIVDNAPQPCDGGAALADSDPSAAAAAMGLCKSFEDDSPWGITSVQYVRADGSPLASSTQNGIMTGFGTNVASQEGTQMLALSTGHSRTPGQADPCNSQTCPMTGAGSAPAGFPQDVPACPGDSDIYDDIALEVTMVAPTNATGFAFNFNFFSFEYPEWVCTSYNDQFVAIVDPAPPGSINGNVSFDSMTNPVSVNIAFFEVCSGCPLGTDELAGTGFDTWNSAGGTSWLETTSPVQGGQEVTIRFLIWDTGDQAYDSTVLIDNFRWIADGGTVAVGTTPVG